MPKSTVYTPEYIKGLVRDTKTRLGYYDPKKNGKQLPDPDRAVLEEFEKRLGARVIGINLNHGNIQVHAYGIINDDYANPVYGTLTVTLEQFDGHDTVCKLARSICEVVQSRARVSDDCADKQAIALKRVMPAQAVQMAGRTIQILEKRL